MGEKTGRFKTRDNDTIRVAFYGSSVIDEKIKFAASPVILQMDGGEREYQPVQYTTASISCISTGVGLFELCTQKPLDVAVEVWNETLDVVLFAGFVTPNVFRQPVDGGIDVVTIECADFLGMSKYVRYHQLNDSFSLRTVTISALLKHIAELIHREPIRILMSDFVRISDANVGSGTNAEHETNEYTKLAVSESYFFDEPASPQLIDGVITLEAQAMSCYDVLSMIAESFRATFVAQGRTLILADVLSSINGNSTFFDLTDNSLVGLGEVKNIDDDSFCSTSQTISALPVYDLFSLTRKQGETRISCDMLNTCLVKKDYPIEDRVEKNGREATYTYVQRLTSDMFNSSPSTSDSAYAEKKPVVSLWGYKEFKVHDNHGFDPFWNKTWTNYIRVCQSTYPYLAYCQIRPTYMLPAVPCEAFSIVLKMEVGRSSERDKLAPVNLNANMDGHGMYVGVSLDGLYYDAENDLWTDEQVENHIEFSGNLSTGWHNVCFVAKNNPENYLVPRNPKGGRMSVFFSFSNTNTVTYIKNLELYLVQDWRYGDRQPETTYKGNLLSQNAYDDVSFPITFGVPKTVKSFSGIIDGVSYAQSTYLKGGLDVPPRTYATGVLDFFKTEADGTKTYYTALDRIEQMATFGDNKEYSLHIFDAHNSISPLDVFTSTLWRGNKAVVGYQKDIELNTINVTLD